MDDKLYLGIDDFQIILNLIRFHYDKDEDRFKALSIDIARQLESMEKMQLSEFILGLSGMCDTFVPMNEKDFPQAEDIEPTIEKFKKTVDIFIDMLEDM